MPRDVIDVASDPDVQSLQAFERWFLAQSQIEHGGQSPIDMLTHYEACWRAWRASEARSMGHAVCTRCGGTGLEP